MWKSKVGVIIAAVAVVVAAGAITAVAAPDVVAPAVTKVRDWAKGAPTTTTLRGQARFEGEAMPYTRVEVHTAKGVFATTTGPDGIFYFKSLPAGEARISVHPYEHPALIQAMEPTTGSDYPTEGAPVVFPRRYRDNATSGLKVELKVGEQWHNLTLSAE